jgi:DNA-binding beta-propeller fold protein YncE
MKYGLKQVTRFSLFLLTLTLILTRAYATTITVRSGPGAIAFDSHKNEIFVSNGAGVSVISDATNKVIAAITVSGGDVGFDPHLNEVFFTKVASNTVSVISDATNTVIKRP